MAMSKENEMDLLRFEEIMSEIDTLAEEAVNIIPKNTAFEDRARAYWFNTITGCIDGRATMHTMQNSLEELKEALSE